MRPGPGRPPRDKIVTDTAVAGGPDWAQSSTSAERDSHVSDELMLPEQRIREMAYQLWEEAGHPEGQQEHFWFLAEARIQQQEDKLDEELAESFPASDPPSSTSV